MFSLPALVCLEYTGLRPWGTIEKCLGEVYHINCVIVYCEIKTSVPFTLCHRSHFRTPLQSAPKEEAAAILRILVKLEFFGRG